MNNLALSIAEPKRIQQVQKNRYCQRHAIKSIPTFEDNAQSIFTRAPFCQGSGEPFAHLLKLTTHNPQFLDSLRRRANARNVSFRISLRWPIHIINPVDETKLPYYYMLRQTNKISYIFVEILIVVFAFKNTFNGSTHFSLLVIKGSPQGQSVGQSVEQSVGQSVEWGSVGSPWSGGQSFQLSQKNDIHASGSTPMRAHIC